MVGGATPPTGRTAHAHNEIKRPAELLRVVGFMFPAPARRTRRTPGDPEIAVALSADRNLANYTLTVSPTRLRPASLDR